MKNLLLIICVCISGSLFGQAEKALIKSVQAANWEEAMTYLNDRVDYCIDDDQDYMKKADCIANLKEMIAKHGVKAWKEVHKGQSKDGNSSYSILESTTSDKPLRILVFSEDNGGSAVTEIRIETRG